MNEKAMPKGISAFKKPIKIGIEEQEQNGVIAPKIAAARFPRPNPDPCISFFNFEGFRNVLTKAIINTTAKIRKRIFRVSYMKKFTLDASFVSISNPSRLYVTKSAKY